MILTALYLVRVTFSNSATIIEPFSGGKKTRLNYFSTCKYYLHMYNVYTYVSSMY